MNKSVSQPTTLIVAFLILTSPGAAMATPEPKFTVESQTEKYEIRKYGSTIVAETSVNAEFDDAGNQAFRILADYIFGNNKAKTKIDMTAPVSQQTEFAKTDGVKIDMTAPVGQVKSPTGYNVQFTMPEPYTLETLPQPSDPRVKLRAIAPRKVAVYKYSGSWSQSRYKEKLAEFEGELKKNGVKTVGEPEFARFDSPFRLWFLRRNEIWFEIAP